MKTFKGSSAKKPTAPELETLKFTTEKKKT